MNFHKFADVQTMCYVIRDSRGQQTTQRGWLITNDQGNLLAVKTLGATKRQRAVNASIMTEAVRVLTAQDLITEKVLVQKTSTGEVLVSDEAFATQLSGAFPGLRINH